MIPSRCISSRCFICTVCLILCLPASECKSGSCTCQCEFEQVLHIQQSLSSWMDALAWLENKMLWVAKFSASIIRKSRVFNIQGIHKGIVRFQKLIKVLFLILHGHSIQCQQQELSKFPMRYQQFASHAYCGAAGPVPKMASQQEKAFCVPRFEVSRSVITVQREFRARFKEDAQHKNNAFFKPCSVYNSCRNRFQVSLLIHETFNARKGEQTALGYYYRFMHPVTRNIKL
jgi:hypothetical protein